jgi:hypothetical protein
MHHLPTSRLRAVREVGYGVLQVFQRLPRPLQELPLTRREIHLPRGALQQPQAQGRFQLVDAPAQGRRRNAEVFGSETEIVAVGHRHESLQFFQGKIDARHASNHKNNAIHQSMMAA